MSIQPALREAGETEIDLAARRLRLAALLRDVACELLLIHDCCDIDALLLDLCRVTGECLRHVGIGKDGPSFASISWIAMMDLIVANPKAGWLDASDWLKSWPGDTIAPHLRRQI